MLVRTIECMSIIKCLCAHLLIHVDKIIYVRMYVCTNESLCVIIHVFVFVRTNVCALDCVYYLMYVDKIMYVRMYVRTHDCMIYMYVYIHIMYVWNSMYVLMYGIVRCRMYFCSYARMEL